MLALEGLEQIVVGAAAHGVDGHADVVNGGHHDHGKLRLLRVDAVQQGNAVAILHHNVGQNQVKGVPFQDLQRFVTAGGQLHIISLAFQRGADHRPDVVLVIHDQNPRRPAQSCGRARFRLRGRIGRGVEHVQSCQVQCQARILRCSSPVAGMAGKRFFLKRSLLCCPLAGIRTDRNMRRTVPLHRCVSCLNPQRIRTETAEVFPVEVGAAIKRLFSQALRRIQSSIHNPQGLESV